MEIAAKLNFTPSGKSFYKLVKPTTFNAEREGFEPSRQLPAYTLSRRTSSTTRAPLRKIVFPVKIGCSLTASSGIDAKIVKTINKTKFILVIVNNKDQFVSARASAQGKSDFTKRSSSKSCQAF